MAKTKISDVVEPSRFTRYVIERTVEKSLLFTSGLVQAVPQIQTQLGLGGRTVNMPYWQEITGNAVEVLSDSAPLSTNKIDTEQDIAVVNYRGAAFSSNDLSGLVAGDDPMRAIAEQVVDFWDVKLQEQINAISKGLIANAAFLATHVNDVSGGSEFSDEAFLDTVFLQGDRQTDLGIIVTHSHVHQKMLEEDKLTIVNAASTETSVAVTNPSQQPQMVSFYRGRRVLVDDGMLVDGTDYVTAIFGPGAFGWAEQPLDEGTELDRDALAGDDFLVTRRSYVLHPRGVAWIGTAASTSPSNSELETGTNWDPRWLDKNIKLTYLVTD